MVVVELQAAVDEAFHAVLDVLTREDSCIGVSAYVDVLSEAESPVLRGGLGRVCRWGFGRHVDWVVVERW